MCWTRRGEAWLFHKCVPFIRVWLRAVFKLMTEEGRDRQKYTVIYQQAVTSLYIQIHCKRGKYGSLQWITDVSVYLLYYLRSRKERSLQASYPVSEKHKDGTNDY